MAVFPDRIVLKTSSNTPAEIEQLIAPSGSDPILPGELVIGLTPGVARIYTVADDGTVVNFGGSVSPSLDGLDNVFIVNPIEGDILYYDNFSGLWKNQLNNLENLTSTRLLSGEYIFYPADSRRATGANGFSSNAYNLGIDSQRALSLFYDTTIETGQRAIVFKNHKGTAESAWEGSAIQGWNNQIFFPSPDEYTEQGIVFSSQDGGFRFSRELGTETSSPAAGFGNSAAIYIESNSTQRITLTVPDDLSGPVRFQLPADNGLANRFLATDGNGNTYWAATSAADLSNSTISELSDVSVENATEGQGIAYDAATQIWIPTTLARTLPDLDGVDLIDMGYSNVGINTPAISFAYKLLEINNADIGTPSNPVTRSVRFEAGYDGWALLGAATEDDLGGAQTFYSQGLAQIGWNNRLGLILMQGYEESTGTQQPVNIVSSDDEKQPSVVFMRKTLGSITNNTPLGDPMSVTIKGPEQYGNYELTLPETLGAPGQVIGTDASGQLSWYDTYPPVGNGLVEFTVNVDVTAATVNTPEDREVTLSGLMYAGTDPSDEINAFVGLQYRIDNPQTNDPAIGSGGFRVGIYQLVTDENGVQDYVVYNDAGITNNDLAGPNVIAWTVQAGTPSKLYLRVERHEWRDSAIYLPINVQGFDLELGDNTLGDVGDINTQGLKEGYGLVYNSGVWRPSPVLLEYSQVYLDFVVWQPETTAAAVDPGAWRYYSTFDSGTNGLTCRIELNTTAFDGASYAVLFDQLVAAAKPLFLRYKLTNDTTYSNALPTEVYSPLMECNIQRLSTNVYELSYLSNSANGNPDLEDLMADPYSIWVFLAEKRELENTVFSVNGFPNASNPDPNVSLGVLDLDDVYVDEPFALLDGFPYSNGASSSAGQYSYVITQQTDGTQKYDLTINNVDFQGVNRRPMALEGSTVEIKGSEQASWIPLGNVSTTYNAASITFEDVSQTAALEFIQNTGYVLFIKFQPVQTDGYTLTENSILLFDAFDQKWKPTDPILDVGVVSVNGQQGNVQLSLNDINEVSVSNAAAGNYLQFNGFTWVPSANVNVSLSDLSDTAEIPLATDGQVLTYESSLGFWVPRSLGGTVSSVNDIGPDANGNIELSLEELDNVSTDTPTAGQVLTWDDATSSWKPEDAAAATGTVQSVNGVQPTADGNVKIGAGDLDDASISARTFQIDAVDALRLNGPTNTTTLDASLATSDVTYYLPPADGSANQVLTTGGNGQLSWTTQSGGGPGAGVAQIIAGNNVTISPTSGTGTVTINAVAGGQGGQLMAMSVSETQTTDASGNALYTDLGWWGELIEIETDTAAWITLYTNAASRTADLTRSFGAQPAPGSGVLFAVNLAANATFQVTPGANYFNNDAVKVSKIYALARQHDGQVIQGATIRIDGYGTAQYTVISGGTFGS